MGVFVKINQQPDRTTNFFFFRLLMNLWMKEGEEIDTFIIKWEKQLDKTISSGNNINEISKYEIFLWECYQRYG